MVGFYIIAVLLVAAFALEPDLTGRILTSAFLKMEVWILNLRMKWAAKRLHAQLARDMKKHFGSEIPPFKWVDLWDRD